MKFSSLIILSPLVYAVHHFEEHIIFNFREWRLKYFLDNNQFSTEEMLIRLMIMSLVLIFFHAVRQNRASAHLVLFFLMTTQVVNAIFHVFFSLWYQDFSPGTITGVLLYLPINFLIVRAALQERYLYNFYEAVLLFIAGAIAFTLFELLGPKLMVFIVLLLPFYYIIMNNLTKNIHYRI